MAFSVLLVCGLYVAINAAYLLILSPEVLAESPGVAAAVFSRVLGDAGKPVITGTILLCAAGALNGMLLAGSRLPFALARDYAKQPHFAAPWKGLIWIGIWSAVLVLWGNFERLLFFSGFAVWFFFTLSGAGLFLLYRRQPASRAILKACGFPLFPGILAGTSLLLFAATIFHAPVQALAGCILLLAGIPVYFLLKRRS